MNFPLFLKIINVSFQKMCVTLLLVFIYKDIEYIKITKYSYVSHKLIIASRYDGGSKESLILVLKHLIVITNLLAASEIQVQSRNITIFIAS